MHSKKSTVTKKIYVKIYSKMCVCEIYILLKSLGKSN